MNATKNNAQPAHNPDRKTEQSTSESSQAEEYLEQGPTQQTRKISWNPRSWRRRPVLGVVGLSFAIACLILCLVVLLVSDGQDVKTWAVKPAVWLAIITAFLDSAVGFAIIQARPISWWIAASKGRTSERLEQEYDAGFGVVSAIAILARGRFSLIAVAYLSTVLVLMGGPLLQHASTTVTSVEGTGIELDITIAPELPKGFSAHVSSSLTASMTDRAIRVFADYIGEVPIVAPNLQCSGNCTTTVTAPGIWFGECVTRSEAITDNMTTWGLDNGTPVLYTDLSFGRTNPQSDRRIQNYTVGIARLPDCSGNNDTFETTTCNLHSALMTYEITVANRSISLNYPSSQNVTALANNTVDDRFGHWESNLTDSEGSLTVAVLVGLAFSYFNMSVSMLYLDGRGRGLVGNGGVAQKYAPFQVLEASELEEADTCKDMFKDPTEDFKAALNEIMFRSGIAAALEPDTSDQYDTNITLNQTVPASQTRLIQVFESSFRWFWGAAALVLCVVLLVLPAFWGWWRLDGDVTFNPLEVGQAFDSFAIARPQSVGEQKGAAVEPESRKRKFGSGLVEMVSPRGGGVLIGL